MNHVQNLVRLLIVAFWLGALIGLFNFAMNINSFLTVSMAQWLFYGVITAIVFYTAFHMSKNFWSLK